MIDQWYLIFFNLLFSSSQLVTGVLDKDVAGRRAARRAAALPERPEHGGEPRPAPPFPWTPWADRAGKIPYEITQMWNPKCTYLQNRFTGFENKLFVTKGEIWHGGSKLGA